MVTSVCSRQSQVSAGSGLAFVYSISSVHTNGIFLLPNKGTTMKSCVCRLES